MRDSLGIRCPVEVLGICANWWEWFEREPLQPGEQVDEWFGRENIDFNLHNYGGGVLRVDAYEVINDAVDTSYWVRVWTSGEEK